MSRCCTLDVSGEGLYWPQRSLFSKLMLCISHTELYERPLAGSSSISGVQTWTRRAVSRCCTPRTCQARAPTTTGRSTTISIPVRTCCLRPGD